MYLFIVSCYPRDTNVFKYLLLLVFDLEEFDLEEV